MSGTPIHRFEFDFVSGLGFGGELLTFSQIQLPDCSVSARIGALTTVIKRFELPHGVENGLNAKLRSALGEIDGNVVRARDLLADFIGMVEAQSGKKLSRAQADQLIVSARHIMVLFDAAPGVSRQ